MKSTIRTIALATVLVTLRAYGQDYLVGDPFSSYVSAQSVGMGGVGTAFPSDNAAATIANPAQLGMFSMSSKLNASTDIAGFLDPHQPLDFSAINVGTSLNKLWPQLPVRASLGIGYSNIAFTYQPPSLSAGGPDIPSNTTGTVNGLSAGIGFDYYIRLGFGYTFKWVYNMFNSTNQEPLKETAEDFGAILQVPVISLVCSEPGKEIGVAAGIKPSLDLNIGYAMRNFGGYINPYWPLPREADLGWSVNTGLSSKVDGHRWRWLSVAWSEQAATSPIYVYSTYEKGLGRFGIWQNLIIGRASATVGVARGGQIGLGEFLYLRAGNITYTGSPTATTFGWGMRLDGLIKCLVFLKSISPQSPFAEFLLNHVDLQYDFGREYDTAYFGGETFESLNLVVR